MPYETETKQETGCDIIVTDIKIFPLKYDGIGSIRALVTIVLNDALIIRGLRIMEDNKSLFLSYPMDTCGISTYLRSAIVPLTRKLSEYIENTVIKQYLKVVAND